MPIVDCPLIAHRGASAVAPENTLPAVIEAARLGAKWIETDVRLTRDGGLVMIHDDRLDRTTNGTGRVVEHTLSEIVALDAGSWFSTAFQNTPAPSLRDFLTCVLDCGMSLQLELKENSGREAELVDAVAAEIRKTWPFGSRDIYLSGFSERITRLSADALPEIPRAIATEFLPPDPEARLRDAKAQILHVQARVNAPETLTPYGHLELGVATINDRETAEAFLRAGATSVLTDYPDLMG